MQSAEATRISLSRTDMLYLPSSWQANDHFRFFWKTRWFPFTQTLLEGQDQPHCEFLFKHAVWACLQKCFQPSPRNNLRQPWQAFTRPEQSRQGMLGWGDSLVALKVISGSRRQAFVKFNACCKKRKNDFFIKLLCNNQRRKYLMRHGFSDLP